MSAVERICVGAIVILFAVIAWAIYDDATAEHYSIRKDKFRCTASHVETGGYFMQSGKTQMWIPTTTTVCDQYTRGAP